MSRMDFARTEGKKYAICQSGYYEDASGFGVNFDTEMLQGLIRNFKSRVLSSGVFVYYGHWDSKRESAGEIVSLETEHDFNSGKNRLYAEIEWTKEGKKKVMDKAYNYFSVEVATNYSVGDMKEIEDEEQGGTKVEKSRTYYGATLTGVALTNEPAVTDLPRMKMSTGENIFGIFCHKEVASGENMTHNNNKIDNQIKEKSYMDDKIQKEQEKKILELSKKLEESAALVKKMEEASHQREKELFEKERDSFSKTLFESEKIGKEVADTIGKISDPKTFATVREIVELSVKDKKIDNGIPGVKGHSNNPKDFDIDFNTKFDSNKKDMTVDDFMEGVQ